jgi:hypothetical protein
MIAVPTTVPGEFCRRCGNPRSAHTSGEPCPTPAQTAQRMAGVLTLSYRGEVSDILRSIAGAVDAGVAKVENFRWSMTDDQLEFSLTLNMKPKDP